MPSKTFEFSFAPIDFYRLVFGGMSWRAIWFRRVVALFIGAFALNEILTNGFGYKPIVLLVAAANVGCTSILLLLMVASVIFAFRPLAKICVDDSEIKLENRGLPLERLPWSSFDYYGKAQETKRYFYLECGRGQIYVPKRAFPNDQELIGFRALVQQKLGTRFLPMKA